MKEILTRVYDFLAAHDFPMLLEAIRKLEWSQMAKSPFTWLIVMPVMVYLLWTKKFKTTTAIVSLWLFLLLVQKTLTPEGETLSLHNLLIFLSGAVALVGLNVYFLFIRQ